MVQFFMYKKIALSLCFTLFLGLLTSCSPKEILHLKKAESPTNQASSTTQKNTQFGAPVAIPPRYDTDKPLKPGQTDTAYMPNGLPALKPMKGLNADTLFSQKIKNTNERFDRVENAVVDIRKEFDSYKPSIVRLAAVESDIQNLIKELEVLLQETPTPQPPLDLNAHNENEPTLDVQQLDPVPKQPPELKEPPKAVKTVEKKPPPVVKQYKDMVVQNLRAGEHADKIRIVLDTNKKSDFSIDLDNDEKLIIIELPDARWIGAKSKTFKSSKLLDSYIIETLNDGKGTMIVLSLKKSTRIMSEKRIGPDGNNGYHRIYFDLAL